MDKFFDFADSFERTAMLYIFRFRKFFWPKSVEKVSKKVDEVVKEYNELITQFNLIVEGKSKLNKRKRDRIVTRVKLLIEKGHIKIA